MYITVFSVRLKELPIFHHIPPIRINHRSRCEKKPRIEKVWIKFRSVRAKSHTQRDQILDEIVKELSEKKFPFVVSLSAALNHSQYQR